MSSLLNKMIGSTNHIIPYESAFAIFPHHIVGVAIGTSALTRHDPVNRRGSDRLVNTPAGWPRCAVRFSMLDRSPGSWPRATLPDQAAEDLAAAGLGQLGHEPDLVGGERLAQRLGDPVAQLGSEGVAGLVAGLQDDEAEDDFPLEAVGNADRGRLGDGAVLGEDRFDLGRARAACRPP